MNSKNDLQRDTLNRFSNHLNVINANLLDNNPTKQPIWSINFAPPTREITSAKNIAGI